MRLRGHTSRILGQLGCAPAAARAIGWGSGLLFFGSIRLFFIAGFLALAGFLPLATPTLAQTTPVDTVELTEQASSAELDLTIFPPVGYLSVKPGESISHRVVLQHHGTIPLQVTPELVSFTTDGKTGAVQLGKPLKHSYIKIQNPDKQLGQPFLLKPKQSLELVLLIAPPAGAELGEQTLSLLLTAQPNTRVVYDTGTQTSGGVASNIVLAVQDDSENQGRIELDSFRLPKFIDSFGLIKFDILAKNTGRNALAVKGEISLSHFDNTELKRWFMFPDVVLANNSRLVRGTSQDPTQLANEEVLEVVPLEYDSPFLIGPYTLTATLVSETSSLDSSTELTTTIIALPFSIMAAVLLSAVLYLGVRAWDRRQMRRSILDQP